VDERLAGKVALVTGGNSGLGEACVRRFRAEGATVVTLDVVDGADHKVDVRDEAGVAAAVDAVVAQHGRLDIVVNSAGVAGGGPAHLVPLEEWERVGHRNGSVSDEDVRKMRARHVKLTEALDELGECFLMDVAQNLPVWAVDPAPQPPGATAFGRPATRARAEEGSGRAQSVAALAAAYFEAESRTVTVRETTQGPLRVRLWVRQVWLWQERRGAVAHPRLLIVRREADGSHKYSLSNAPAGTSWKRLGFMQAQRFFIERAFQDAKSELGMAHYEVRGWRGWHHHIALCCLALLFTLKERIAAAEHVPLLSVRDIVELLDFYLPSKTRDPDQVLIKLHARHAARAAASASARKRRPKIVTKSN